MDNPTAGLQPNPDKLMNGKNLIVVFCNKNTNNIKVEDCNCALESEVEKCSTAGITGVPTVLVENNSSVQEYTGSRDLNTLITFVESC